MFTTFIDIIWQSWLVMGEMAPYLLLGFLVAGVLSVCIPPSWVERWLGRPGMLPVLTASAVGAPLPLCSCGVIPVAASIRQHGASRAATASFLLSTPQTGVDSILVTYGMLGGVLAIFRPVVALLTGALGGAMVLLIGERDLDKLPAGGEKRDAESDHGKPSTSHDCCAGETGATQGDCCSGETPSTDGCCEAEADPTAAELTSCCESKQSASAKTDSGKTAGASPSCCSAEPKAPTADCCATATPRRNPVVRALHYGLVTLPRDLANSLLIGVLIAGLITALVDPGQFHEVFGGGLIAILVMMALAVPVYVCATASVPLAAGLIYAGTSPGAALAFLIAGPATNAATVATIWRVLGRRSTAAYLLTIGGAAIGAGLLLDWLWPNLADSMPAVAQHAHQHESVGVATHLWAALLLILLGFSYIQGWWARRK